jgi:YidC/Oxa1 family membrane protein insertase
LKQENSGFFDSKTILAMLICFATFWLWQSYLAKKYPDAFKAKTKQTDISKSPETASKEVAGAPVGKTSATKMEATLTPSASETSKVGLPAKEEFVHIENEDVSFDISSIGMGLKNYQLNKYKNRKGIIINYGPISLLETRLLGRQEPLIFKVDRVNDKMFVGHARVGSMEVTKSMELGPTPFSIRYKVLVTGPDDRFVGLSTVLPEEASEPHKGFFAPPGENEEMYVKTSETHDRIHFAKDNIDKSWSNVKIAAIGSQYFAQSLVDKSGVMPEAKGSLQRDKNFADLVLNYTSLNKGQPFEISYDAFVGPKALHLLKETDESLAELVDFGFFGFLGRPILAMLRWFFSIIGNWGIAIIALTILVRLLVLPFNLMSYKSMKAMQAIQPMLAKVKEKYKNDQAKVQQETMALMREHRVNPLGGCLPILLQMPIFFALYQVLGHSIELYQSPFAFWIHDLSIKDPFYVLPVLMGTTMFLQQKITPMTNVDPAQAQIFKFMPILFAMFMISVPSGLTLYIFVSSAFAVIQQYYFMRHSRAKVVALTQTGVKK